MTGKLLSLVSMFFIPFGNYGQSIAPVHIGDSMPPTVLRNVFNQAGTAMSLSDFKGKLVIIDFWSKWCGTCIEAFPKMEKLQKQFGDKIKILLVTKDKDEELKKLFKKIRLPLLPVISEDTVLNNMFPHITEPHHVWINPDGRVQFITDGYNATAQNVTKVLEGRKFNLQVKTESTDVDVDADLWKEGNGRFHKYITNYSFVMSHVKENWHGGGFSFVKDPVNGTYGFRLVNIPLLDLYRVAFGGNIDCQVGYFARDNRIQLIGKGVHHFLDYPAETDSIPAWIERNLISYESKWKIKNDSLAYQFLRDDANRFFPFSASIESKEVACYILKKAPGFRGSQNRNVKKFVKYTDSSYIQKNMPVSVIIESLNGMEPFKKFPVVDETKYSLSVDITLENAFNDIVKLTKELLKNGLILEEGRRRIRMLVLRDK